MIIADSDKYIHFLGKPYEGSTHDYGILKAEFPLRRIGLKTMRFSLI
ncbi:MAG: hypothetical protein HC913_19745 [Microscillaceae bacterium]|nr:hypothetical protein [Microscillaceae bacterium]